MIFLVGHSSGAMTILRLAEQMKIKALILVSAGYANEKTRIICGIGRTFNRIHNGLNNSIVLMIHLHPSIVVDILLNKSRVNYHEFNDRNHFLCTEFPDLIDVD